MQIVDLKSDTPTPIPNSQSRFREKLRDPKGCKFRFEIRRETDTRVPGFVPILDLASGSDANASWL